MPVPSNPRLSEVQDEFSAPASAKLSAFYRGGSYVPDTSVNNGVPQSGELYLSDLVGASAYTDMTLTISGDPTPNGSCTGANEPCTATTDSITCTVSGGSSPYTITTEKRPGYTDFTVIEGAQGADSRTFEYRTTNSDRRLSHLGRAIGLLPESTYLEIMKRQKKIDGFLVGCDSRTTGSPGSSFISSNNHKPTHSKRAKQATKNGSVSAHILKDEAVTKRNYSLIKNELDAIIKYAPYIHRQEQLLSRILQNDRLCIPKNFEYFSCLSLSMEAREKLSIVLPETLGQASRVSGVTPSDIAALSVVLGKA